MSSDSGSLEQLIVDLERQAQWAEIIPYVEKHSDNLLTKQKKSPATYAKHKRWLLNTERMSIAQVLVFRKLCEEPTMSQGEFVRLLGGNPYREGISPVEQQAVLNLNQYWANQIRNNIRPIMADYFGLMTVSWGNVDKPGTGEYSICASQLLLDFFTDVLYA